MATVVGRYCRAKAGLQVHHVTWYSTVELRTLYLERVRKMPLSGLDPSMLIEFLYKTEAD